MNTILTRGCLHNGEYNAKWEVGFVRLMRPETVGPDYSKFMKIVFQIPYPN